jgi:hypothetical protein
MNTAFCRLDPKQKMVSRCPGKRTIEGLLSSLKHRADPLLEPFSSDFESQKLKVAKVSP